MGYKISSSGGKILYYNDGNNIIEVKKNYK
jgi:hypothetical protein